MGQTNGKITETNISIQDIHDAIEYDSYSVKSLWGSNKINKWSKYKPQDTYTLYGLQYDKMYQLNAQDIVEQLIVPAQRDTFGYPVPKKDLKFSSFGKYYQHCQSPFIQFSGSQVGEKYRIDFGANANVSTDEAQIKLTEIAETNGAYYIVYKTISEGETTYYEFEATKFGNAESDHSHLFENTTSKDVQYVGCVVIAVNGDTNQCIVYPNSFFNFTLKGKNLLEKVDITMQSYSLKKFNDDTYELKNSSIRIQNNNPEEVTLKLEWIYLKEHSVVSLIPEFANTTLVIAKNDYIIFNLVDYPDRFTESKGESPFIEIRVFLDGTNLYRDYPQELQAETVQPKANISGSYSNNQSTTSISGTVNVDAVDGNGDIPGNVVLTVTAYNGNTALKSYTYTNPDIVYEGGRFTHSFSITGIDVRNITSVEASYETYGSGPLTNNMDLVPDLDYIDPSALIIDVGESVYVNINTSPADASYTVDSYSSSDTSIATVNSSGRVTGKAVGHCTITVVVISVYGTEKRGTCSVTVNSARVVTVSGYANEAYETDTTISGRVEVRVQNGTLNSQYLTITAYSYGGSAIGDTDIWISSITNTYTNPSYTIYLTGNHTASDVRDIQAVLNDERKSDTWGVDIVEPPPEVVVQLSTYSKTLIVGDSFSITATPYVDGVVTGSIRWEAGSGLSLSAYSGKTITVTAQSSGTYSLTAYATYDGYSSSTCTVTVRNQEVSVSVSPSEEELEVGESTQLSASVRGTDNTAVRWSSSNSNIASVNDNGYVTAHQVGECYITATSDEDRSKSDSCYIRVTEAFVETRSFGGSAEATGTNSLSIDISCSSNVYTSAADIDFTIRYSSGSPQYETKTKNAFSAGISNQSYIITTDQATSKITSITAVWYGMTETIHYEAPSNNLSGVSTRDITIEGIGNFGYIDWETIPSNPDDFDHVSYRINDTSIASVNSNTGVVTAKSGGSTGFTVTAHSTSGRTFSDSGTITVTVPYIPDVMPESITITDWKSSMDIGDTYTFTAEVKPTNTTNKAVNWSTTSSSIATVEKETGFVRAISAGTVTITAYCDADNSIRDGVSVTVNSSGGGGGDSSDGSITCELRDYDSSYVMLWFNWDGSSGDTAYVDVTIYDTFNNPLGSQSEWWTADYGYTMTFNIDVYSLPTEAIIVRVTGTGTDFETEISLGK